MAAAGARQERKKSGKPDKHYLMIKMPKGVPDAAVAQHVKSFSEVQQQLQLAMIMMMVTMRAWIRRRPCKHGGECFRIQVVRSMVKDGWMRLQLPDAEEALHPALTVIPPS